MKENQTFSLSPSPSQDSSSTSHILISLPFHVSYLCTYLSFLFNQQPQGFYIILPPTALGLAGTLNLSLNQSQEIQSTSFENFIPILILQQANFSTNRAEIPKINQNKLFWWKPQSVNSRQSEPYHTNPFKHSHALVPQT